MNVSTASILMRLDGIDGNFPKLVVHQQYIDGELLFRYVHIAHKSINSYIENISEWAKNNGFPLEYGRNKLYYGDSKSNMYEELIIINVDSTSTIDYTFDVKDLSF